MYISQIIDAFLFTNVPKRWEEIATDRAVRILRDVRASVKEVLREARAEYSATEKVA